MAIVLALHDMSCKSSGISNQGYFHWKTHIISFIDRNWQNLFSQNLKRRKNWLGTIAGILSHNSPSFFLSGTSDLNDNGWWKLSHDLLPGVYSMLYADVISVRNNVRNKFKDKDSLMTKDEFIVLQLLKDYGLIEQHEIFEKYINGLRSQFFKDVDKYENDTSSDDELHPYKMMHLQSDDSNNFMDDVYSEKSYLDPSELFDINIDDGHVNSILESDDQFNWKLFSSNLMNIHKSDKSVIPVCKQEFNSDKVDVAELAPIKSLFNVNIKPKIRPWSNSSPNISYKNIQSLTEYQEHELYAKLKHYLKILNDDPNISKHIDKAKLCEIRRLHCKLKVRKELRKLNIDFNLDRLVSGQHINKSNDSAGKINILDKFQVVSAPVIDNISFATRLTGMSLWSCFVSPYTNKELKPFVRRDYETISPWIKLMNEIKMKVNKEQGKRAPIDYCYVRPHHIAVINSLCEHFYWPGIDVSDVLQYPDYTVVALYKKLVVGFALLVPDANHNEAYISFLWTRPNWQKCGIGSFMLYHLIQTCIGKDITLHVSATNPALILYQKFGFKVEEFILDFYDKYMHATSKECKHALYLRLSR
ncbi:cysteine-rich protein 2-binding protein-like [Ctenocephalides felis]|uniref:cysteine-rich protein 2-binding protein-like n=1 Tax=Ctenocephalides felis TaxID=7515 RepID=UPI000E6E106F|nr:cysteine-rich protein 2-binding protein-like [Ctenocephalides felis]